MGSEGKKRYSGYTLLCRGSPLQSLVGQSANHNCWISANLPAAALAFCLMICSVENNQDIASGDDHNNRNAEDGGCNSGYALVLTLSEFSSQLVASGWSELGITEAAPLNTQIPSELPQYFPDKYKTQRLLPHETAGVSFKLIKISGGESGDKSGFLEEKVILLCVGHLLIKEKQFRLPLCEETSIVRSIFLNQMTRRLLPSIVAK